MQQPADCSHRTVHPLQSIVNPVASAAKPTLQYALAFMLDLCSSCQLFLTIYNLRASIMFLTVVFESYAYRINFSALSGFCNSYSYC